MRERRRNTTSSASYTGFRAVEGFQYPGVWKKAAQSVGSLLLICGVAVLTAASRRLGLRDWTCGAACPEQTYIDVGAVTASALDVLLHALLLVSLHKKWSLAMIAVVVWNALKGAALVYLLVLCIYNLQTRGSHVIVFEHMAALVALVPVQVVVLYTLSWATHEQRAANQIEDNDLP